MLMNLRLMQKKIMDRGAEIISLYDLKIYNDTAGGLKIFSQGDFIKTKNICIVTDLDDAFKFFEHTVLNNPSIYYLPQIFYFFSIDKLNSRFQICNG